MCSCATRLSGALPGGVRRWGEPAHRPPTGGGPGVNTMTVSKAYQALKAEGFLRPTAATGPPSAGRGTPNGVFREKLAEELEPHRRGQLKGVPREEFFSLCTAAFAGNGGVTMLLFIIFLFCDLLMVGSFCCLRGKRPYAEGMLLGVHLPQEAADQAEVVALMDTFRRHGPGGSTWST